MPDDIRFRIMACSPPAWGWPEGKRNRAEGEDVFANFLRVEPRPPPHRSVHRRASNPLLSQRVEQHPVLRHRLLPRGSLRSLHPRFHRPEDRPLNSLALRTEKRHTRSVRTPEDRLCRSNIPVQTQTTGQRGPGLSRKWKMIPPTSFGTDQDFACSPANVSKFQDKHLAGQEPPVPPAEARRPDHGAPCRWYGQEVAAKEEALDRLLAAEMAEMPSLWQKCHRFSVERLRIH